MMTLKRPNKKYISNLVKYNKEVRSRGYNLINRLDDFPNSVFVTGCQRSGTTMLSRIITQVVE